MELIDTHAHLDDERFPPDEIDAVIKRANDSNVRHIIIPGIHLESSEKARDLAEKYKNIYFAAGIHCHEVRKNFNEKNFFLIRKLLEEKKAVAIGEIGLDYHYDFSPPSLQKHVLKRYLELAAEKINKPLILHCREAEEDLYDYLKEYEGRIGGVIHCYTGSVHWAQKFIGLGFHIGFTGIITFPKSDEIRNVVKGIPLERILCETDSPYMAPVPFRGKRNEPANVVPVVEKLAQIREKTIKEMAGILMNNAKRCFNL